MTRNEGTARSFGLLEQGLALYVAARLLLLAWASLSVRFVMDEMAFLSQFGFFSQGLYRHFDPVKTVLATYLFNAPRTLFSDSVSLLLSARVLGFAVAALVIGIAFLTARRLHGDCLAGVVTAATLLSFTNFSERAFRIRADSLASLLAISALAAVLCLSRPALRAWAGGVLAGAAFLATQKAIYVALAIGVAFLVAGDGRELSWRSRTEAAARFAAAWSLTVLAYGVALGGTAFADVIGKVFFSPTELAFSSHTLYRGLGAYRVVSLRQNFLLYLACAGGFALFLGRWRQLEFLTRFTATTSAVLVPLCFAHNQPWPYVFALPQIFLSLWVPGLLRSAAKTENRPRRLVVLGLLVALATSVPRAVTYPVEVDNAEQLRLVTTAEAMLSPSERYFDGIGMLPGRVIAGQGFDWWWDRPGLLRFRAALRAGDRTPLDRIHADHPKLWILNYRTLGVWPEIEGDLGNSYVRVSSSLMLSGVLLADNAAGPSVFICRYPGRYRLYSMSGLPLAETFSVDGAEARHVADLPAGLHQVRPSDPAQDKYLLPDGIPLAGAMPDPRQPVPDLFAGVYDY